MRAGPFALWTYLGSAETWDHRTVQKWRNHKGRECLYDEIVSEPKVGRRYLIKLSTGMLGDRLDNPAGQTQRLSLEDQRRLDEMMR